jgi:hypothetical protein
MFPDADIFERRLRQIQNLPWPIPACVLMEMTDEDLDHLDAADDTDEYWTILNAAVTRIQTNNDREANV